MVENVACGSEFFRIAEAWVNHRIKFSVESLNWAKHGGLIVVSSYIERAQLKIDELNYAYSCVVSGSKPPGGKMWSQHRYKVAAQVILHLFTKDESKDLFCIGYLMGVTLC